MEKERMKLVIDGNAVYEVDQNCMDRGINRPAEDMQRDSRRKYQQGQFQRREEN